MDVVKLLSFGQSERYKIVESIYPRRRRPEADASIASAQGRYCSHGTLATLPLLYLKLLLTINRRGTILVLPKVYRLITLSCNGGFVIDQTLLVSHHHLHVDSLPLHQFPLWSETCMKVLSLSN
ncbi:hypothetical protein YC2023_054186 [Brassica napus]